MVFLNVRTRLGADNRISRGRPPADRIGYPSYNCFHLAYDLLEDNIRPAKIMPDKMEQTIPAVHYRPGHELDSGFELLELSSIYKRSATMEHNPFTPHRVDFHHLIYISGGEGTHYIDFNQHSYRKGSFISVNRHQVHAFDADCLPVGLVALFTQEFIDSIQINIRIPAFATGFYSSSETPIQTVTGSLRGSCEALLAEINKVVGDEPHDPIIVKLLFMTLLLKLHREKPDTLPKHISEASRKHLVEFLSLLHQHFTSTKSAAAYADLMGITYKTLNQLCTQAVGKTPKQLIDEHTVLEAKRRLAIEQTQVTQLAYELGFDDSGNFVKYFKKHTLMTPSAFQKTIAG